MSVVLGFTVATILPVFLDVYQNMAGGLAASSFSMVDVGIGIGWVALAITVLCTLMVLVAFVRSHSAKGRLKLLHSFEKFPGTKKPFFELAQARFTSTLAVYTASGVRNLPRTTAQGIYNQCAIISPSEAKPGDIIFFTGTYDSPGPVSHVGIYVGDGMMLHCGSPIQYANINSSYWQTHFYAFGRL